MRRKILPSYTGAVSRNDFGGNIHFNFKVMWLLNQGCGNGYFLNRFRTYCFQQNLDSISSMKLLTSMAIKTSSLQFTRANH